MKNITKLLFFSLITCVLFIFGFYGVEASSKSITIKSSKNISAVLANSAEDFIIYKTQDKKTVYGLEFDKKALKKNMKLTYDKKADAGLLYILENGYPKSKITGNNELDKYITEAAIWLYMDKTNQGNSVNAILKKDKNNTSELVFNYINSLVDKAIQAKNAGYKTKKTSMKILKEENSLFLSKNKKYYESGYIAVDLVGSNKYTVSSDATILDVNGKKKNKFNSSEVFKIRIPISKISDNDKISVTVKASSKENIAKIYVPNNDKYQSVVGLFSKKHSLKESLDLPIVASKACKYIDGNYHDKDGNVTNEQNYKNECSRSCKIINENYYDIKGEETSKLLFDKYCLNSCVTEDDLYFGIESRNVDKVTFEKECSIFNAAYSSIKNNSNNDNLNLDNENMLEVEVPDTNANVLLINILFGVLLVLTGLGIIYKRNKAIN